MNEYKRMTTKYSKEEYRVICDNCEKKGKFFCCDEDCLFAATQRLGEFEDKIEQGLLVELRGGE